MTDDLNGLLAQHLAEAIKLILTDRRDDGLRGLPADAERDTVIVKVA
jgi:hypothetical protein